MKLSIIIIAKNEEEMIKDCLKSAAWADEVILVDTGSIDRTLEIAKEILPKVKIIKTKKGSFSDWRNLGFKKSQGDWVLYLDADERVSSKRSVLAACKDGPFCAFRIPRENYYFGKRVKYGGSWPDYATRLFKRKSFTGWKGIIHESPKFKGKLGTLKNPLIHLTHRNIGSCLEKGLKWTRLEARLFYKAKHPPVTWWRLLKVAGQEFFKRAILLQGFKDGFVGIVEAMVQAINRLMVYIQLWEMQQKTLNIALYSPFLDENIGGGERYLLTIAEHLSKKHQVDLFLNQPKKRKIFLRKYSKKFNLNISKVKISPVFFQKLSFIKRLFLTKKYDCFLLMTDGSFFFSLSKRNIVHFQIPFPIPPNTKCWEVWINKLKLKNWTVKVANSFFTQRHLKKNWDIKVDFVHWGAVSRQDFKPMKKRKIILNVGRFFTPSGFKHCKKQDFLVETFKKMCDHGLRGWTFMLNGPVDKGRDNFEYAQKVKKMVKGYPVVIRHESDFFQLQKDYGQSYIYWHAAGYGINENKHPEAVEHLGLSTIEAMSAGAVPIVINKGGQKEIIKHNRNGLLWNTQEELIKRTLEVIRDKKLFLKLSEEAQKRAKDFSKDKFNKMTEEIFGL